MSSHQSSESSEARPTPFPPTASPPTGSALPAGGAGGSARSPASALRSWLRSSGVEAVARLIAWLGYALFTHGLTLLQGVGATPDRRAASRARARARLTRMGVAQLGALKGAFAKAGQFAATRHDLVAAEQSQALGQLQDRVPPLAFSEIRRVIEADFGAPIESLFAQFEHDPIGAASIAQVHRARLRDGREVAVKVQYPWIADSLPSDLVLLRWAFRLVLGLRRHTGPVGRFDRVFAEFASGIGHELDFRAEARAAEAIAANLADDAQVVVPEIVESHTRERVLTMRYSPCVSIGDRPGLARIGAEPGAVLEVLARAYAKQVFVDGLFHADPHPGNLFVLDEPQARRAPRVLFVDFGLCKQLDPELRRAMRQGIYALLKRDVPAFVDRMAEMGMIAEGARPGVEAAVRRMFEQIATESGDTNVLAASGAQILSLKDEAKRLLQQTPGLQLPNDLLLYAKTLSYLFALGDALDPDFDLMKRTLPYLLRFLAARD